MVRVLSLGADPFVPLPSAGAETTSAHLPPVGDLGVVAAGGGAVEAAGALRKCRRQEKQGASSRDVPG